MIMKFIPQPFRRLNFFPSCRTFVHATKYGIWENKKNIDTIITVQQYYDVLQKLGTLLKIGNNFEFFDQKTTVSQVMKKPNQWRFQFTVTKRFIFKHGTSPSIRVLVQGESHYNLQLGTATTVCCTNIKKCVQRLLRLHFGEAWDTLPQLKWLTQLE